MDALVKTGTSPNSADLAGWREVIAAGRLGEMSLEAMASALQDLGTDANSRVRNALAKYLSDFVIRYLHGVVWKSHPNGGQDIIDRTHAKIFIALGRTGCPDAVDMRTKFKTVLSFRLKDAIAEERRAHRDPDEDKARENKKKEKERKATRLKAKAQEAGASSETDEEIEFEPLAEQADDDPYAGDESGFRPTARFDSAILDGVRELDNRIDFERDLEKLVPDPRKRLAIWLVMKGVPRKSKNFHSVAEAVGADESTVRKWIADVTKEQKKRKEPKS